MKYFVKDHQLVIETTAYQGKNGGIYIDWGNQPILLDKFPSENIVMDIPDFDIDAWRKFYLDK